MTEKRLYTEIKKVLKKDYPNVTSVRLENSVASGLPDVVLLTNRNIFIELKTGLYPKMRERQLAYFQKAILDKNKDYYILSSSHTKEEGYEYLLFFYSQNQKYKIEYQKLMEKTKDGKYNIRLVPCVMLSAKNVKDLVAEALHDK